MITPRKKVAKKGRLVKSIKDKTRRLMAIRIKEDPADKTEGETLGDYLFLTSVAFGLVLTVNLATFVSDHI